MSTARGPIIHLLWPTVRPEVMKATHAHWMETAARRDRIRVKLAVNTVDDRNRLSQFQDVMVIGNSRRGAPHAVFRLFQAVAGEPSDIAVLVSDDTYSPPSWDTWLEEQFAGHDDAIIINDGGQFGPCVTQPILTVGCVLKLNRIINHPSYNHFCADAELYSNLCELGLVRDLRGAGGPVFEHRNWAWGKREKDHHDEHNVSLWGVDEQNLHSRMQLPIAERLKADAQFMTFQETGPR